MSPPAARRTAPAPPKERATRRAIPPAAAATDAARAPAEPAPSALQDPLHDLQTSIPYLIARAGMMTGQTFSAELKGLNLTLTEWRVCAVLRHQPHQRLSDLAAATSTDASTLSRTVDGLLQRGLLLRERSPDDARAVALALTPAGNDLTERVIPLARLYERVALSGIEPAQVDLLRGMLLRIYDNMATLAGRG